MPAIDKNESILNQVENAAERWLLGRDEDIETIENIVEILKKNGRLKHFNR